MDIGGRTIDHIVYSVPNLEEAIHWFEINLGLRPTIGGRHLNKGTKNALLNLGNQCYLEILAVDHENKNVNAPRWMGVDVIKEAKITRWAIKSTQLAKDQNILKHYHPKMGVLEEGKRQTPTGEFLKWKMILPLSKPEVELIPFMVDWSDSAFHPTEKLTNDCTLESIQFSCSNNLGENQSCFKHLFYDLTIGASATTSINISIKGPKGSIRI